MKIRSGFVSNSSSSSFIAVMKEDEFNRMIDAQGPLARAFMEARSLERGLGDCVMFSSTTGEYDDLEGADVDAILERAKELGYIPDPDGDEDDKWDYFNDDLRAARDDVDAAVRALGDKGKALWTTIDF